MVENKYFKYIIISVVSFIVILVLLVVVTAIPKLKSANPTNNSTDISIKSDIVLQFNKKLSKKTESTFKIINDSFVPEGSVETVGNKVIFKLSKDYGFLPNSEYKIEITPTNFFGVEGKKNTITFKTENIDKLITNKSSINKTEEQIQKESEQEILPQKLNQFISGEIEKLSQDENYESNLPVSIKEYLVSTDDLLEDGKIPGLEFIKELPYTDLVAGFTVDYTPLLNDSITIDITLTKQDATSKEKALNWLKSKNIDINKFQINYL